MAKYVSGEGPVLIEETSSGYRRTPITWETGRAFSSRDDVRRVYFNNCWVGPEEGPEFEEWVRSTERGRQRGRGMSKIEIKLPTVNEVLDDPRFAIHGYQDAVEKTLRKCQEAVDKALDDPDEDLAGTTRIGGGVTYVKMGFGWSGGEWVSVVNGQRWMGERVRGMRRGAPVEGTPAYRLAQ